ncbi:YndM family protein [Oceanobacillus manasiensis]|uniref:YndM family protein n=1 Tax=Oceanobacillus manasiensis TaxID=586413 RepID=UPI0005A94A64|nr:YndM family protein [Oceanobacillus manasiensis]
MNHIKPIAIKVIAALVLLFVVLGLVYEMPFGDVLFITLTLGVVSYLIGDLFILPRTNNTVASISDFVLAFALIFMMSEGLEPTGEWMVPALISSIGVAAFEAFFHKYVSRQLENDSSTSNVTGSMNLGTEVSEELDPKDNYDK